MKLSDYVAQFLVDHGLTQVFMVTGGGAMHLNDSLGHHPGLNVVFNHHEQACAMAAEGYARIANKPAVVNVTTGPGGINALNGVFGAWTDSIPMLVLSGQVKRETCMASYPGLGVRQLGDQEADIISMAEKITKYAITILDPALIKYHLQRALFLATSGRPGPCWLDIPVDVQSAVVPAEMKEFDRDELPVTCTGAELGLCCKEIVAKLKGSKRPVIMVGKGVRSAGGEVLFEKIIRQVGVPVVTAWTGIDMIPSDDPLYCGRPGDIGDRPGNFAVQNADFLLILGTRLGLRQVSYNWKTFSRESYKVHIDADSAEFHKPTERVDLAVQADLKEFLAELDRNLDSYGERTEGHDEWLRWCRDRLQRYPVIQPHHLKKKGEMVNPYHFMDVLFQELLPNDIIVCSNGAANVIGYQCAKLKKGQRMFCNTGSASMGFGLPAAIGAASVSPHRRVVCLEGDGSIMMNLQELQTLVQYGYDVVVFVLNNGGYLSIRQSQKNFFGRVTGESNASGISFPDYEALGHAFHLKTHHIAGEEFKGALRNALKGVGPTLCNVILDPVQGFEPKLAARTLPDGRIISPPLEDMFPFLSRAELRDNLLIKPCD